MMFLRLKVGFAICISACCLFTFNNLVVYSTSNDIEIASLEKDVLEAQDKRIRKQMQKREKKEKVKREKQENKQIKKEAKQNYKRSKKQAKIAKIENKRANLHNAKAKQKITSAVNLTGNNVVSNSRKVNSKRLTINNIKKNKNISKSQKKIIKQVEKMTFIDDNAILDIIDNQIAPVSYKQIRVNTKNKGVPSQCLGVKNNVVNNNKNDNEQKKENKDTKEVENRKKNLKEHILKSLQANEIKPELVNKIYSNLTHIESTVVKNNNFIKKTTADFIKNYNVPTRSKSGKVYKKLYKKELQTVEDIFYVEPSAILMIWAMETNYGSNIGNYNAFNALYSACLNATTMARIEYFENNLIMLAKLVDYGYFKEDVISSFDGGLGGCQFMPDSFYLYGVSFDGGKADIINNNKDVFASIGNYLYNMGWRNYGGVLTEITLPENFDICQTGLNTTKTIAEWKKLGVQVHSNHIGEQFFSNDDTKASIIIIDVDNSDIPVGEKRAFLVYDNFKVILGYNPRVGYAITAGLLYDALSQE